MLINALIIVAGLALLAVGADLLVRGATGIAHRFGISDRVAGLTVCAVGTAMPEVFVSVTSAIEGHADMAFGNVLGSCMANLLLILGLSAMVRPLNLSRRTQRFDIPACLLSIAVLAVVANTGEGVTFAQGVILLVAFVLFMAATVRGDLNDSTEGEDAEPELEATVEAEGVAVDSSQASDGARSLGIIREVALIVAGVALLKIGADFAVDSAVAIAEGLGISERIIGVTVVALGTCLPELVTSIAAAMRGNTDLAVGNIVGSNITNVLLVMGAPALFTTVPYATGYNLDLVLLTVFTIVLLLAARHGEKNTFNRREGAVFVLGYAAYIAISLMV